MRPAIEDFAAAPPILLAHRPDVLAITGGHSTPWAMEGHSWHPLPLPVLLRSASGGSDQLERFTETGANSGRLDRFESKHVMRLRPANARLFDKDGA